MWPPLATILGAVSIICGILMYFNMRRSIELKNLREEVSSMSLVADDLTTEHIENNIIEEPLLEVQDSIRKLAEEQLSKLKKELDELRDAKILLQTGYTDTLPTQTGFTEIASDMSAKRINYADEFLGARIIAVECEPVEVHINIFSWFFSNAYAAQNILNSSMKPGCCFAFKGSRAKVTILLSETIEIDALELQHITKHESPTKETSSAPRQFSAHGIDTNGVEIYFGHFEFNNEKPFQLFTITAKNECHKIRLNFLSNHGNKKFSCVYRVAVYGNAIKSFLY